MASRDGGGREESTLRTFPAVDTLTLYVSGQIESSSAGCLTRPYRLLSIYNWGFLSCSSFFDVKSIRQIFSDVARFCVLVDSRRIRNCEEFDLQITTQLLSSNFLDQLLSFFSKLIKYTLRSFSILANQQVQSRGKFFTITNFF